MDNLTFEVMCVKLLKRENFSFQRLGDGEWHAILGDEGMNCDNHPFYDDLGLALSLTLLRPQICYMGMQPFAIDRLGARIAEWEELHGCKIEWCDADIIHDASIAGKIGEMFMAMRGRKKILVGPSHLKPIADQLQATYIHCPDKYPAWKAWTAMYADVVDAVDQDAVVMYCASLASGVLIDKACREYGETITQIDVGSALDVYVGKCSRRYHAGVMQRLVEEEAI